MKDQSAATSSWPRRILAISYAYAPSVGGVEQVGALVSEAFREAGIDVRVLTATKGPLEDGVLRRPGLFVTLRAHMWADVVWHNHPSFRYLWPRLFLTTPAIVVFHTFVPPDRPLGRFVKRRLLRGAILGACSESLASQLPHTVTHVLPNPYRASVFRETSSDGERTGVVFVGRLFKEKGVADLIEALALLRDAGVATHLTVVGDGPDLERLVRIAEEKDISNSTTFLSSLPQEELHRVLRQHRVLAAPSTWQEPFGIVVLEGLAAGCRVVASDVGGLPVALGGHGRLVPARDAPRLAAALRASLADAPLTAAELDARSAHLRTHEPIAVSASYLEAMRVARRRQRCSRSRHTSAAGGGDG